MEVLLNLIIAVIVYVLASWILGLAGLTGSLNVLISLALALFAFLSDSGSRIRRF